MKPYHKSSLSLIDPFNDKYAYKRVGDFIINYMKNLDNDVKRDKALNNCIEKYKKSFGADKVWNRMDIKDHQSTWENHLE